MHLDPAGEVLRIRKVLLQRREIEIALLRLRVVAVRAVFVEKRRRLDGLERGTDCERKRGSGEPFHHAISSPRIVPFAVENSPVSIPSRWSIER